VGTGRRGRVLAGTGPLSCYGRSPVCIHAGRALVVRVTGAATGEMDVFHGDQHRQVTDRELAAALLRHAR
jgi:hypothetical protein